MSNSPLFSIITVTKDNAEGLQKTAQSLERQIFPDFEWVVVNGGQDNKTLAQMQTLQIDRLVNEKDNGPYDGMNKGIPICKGQYTIFLNAGDSLADKDTLYAISNIITGQSEFLYGDSWEKDKDNLFYKKSRPHSAINRGMFTHHQAMIYKTQLLQKYRYNTQYKLAADYDLTLQYLTDHSKAQYLARPLCIFQAGGLSQKNPALGRAEQFTIRKNNNACSPMKNHIIYYAQAANYALRKYIPIFYWFFKSRW